jgi:hypothetical protein
MIMMQGLLPQAHASSVRLAPIRLDQVHIHVAVMISRSSKAEPTLSRRHAGLSPRCHVLFLLIRSLHYSVDRLNTRPEITTSVFLPSYWRYFTGICSRLQINLRAHFKVCPSPSIPLACREASVRLAPFSDTE